MKDKRPTKRFAAPARAGRPLRPQQLLILAYAAAVIVWLVYVLVGSAVMLNHKADGTMVTRTLTVDDLEFESFVNYDGIPRRWMNPAGIFPPTTTRTSSGGAKPGWKRRSWTPCTTYRPAA